MSKSSIAVLFAVILLGGCGVTYSQQVSVEIPGSDPNEQKLADAEALGKDLWSGPLKPYILKNVPGTTESDLDGLGLRWGIFTTSSAATGKGSRVLITCVYSAHAHDDRFPKVLDACKQLVSVYVAKRARPA